MWLLLLLFLAPQKLGFGLGLVPNLISDEEYCKDDFPSGFVFGAATSAYQYEGAVDVDGRSPSIWDTFTHAGHMSDKSTGDITAGGYYKYKEDVKHMSDMGLEAYRFSISWSRLIPNGRGEINPKGLEFYNNVIDELIEYGIQPHVTLLHQDLPQIIEDEYSGWLSPKIVEDFTAYADVCFREFGDRVRHWITFNEPNMECIPSYDLGSHPPQRCSYPFGLANCSAGNSTIEPYIAVHHFLLAHTEVASLYKRKYQVKQNGWIGVDIYAMWMSPLTNSTADIIATQRALDFQIGWIINPLVFGAYPEIMKKRAGSRIPSFTNLQSEQLIESFDFIGINYYTSVYVTDDIDPSETALRDYNKDMSVKMAGRSMPYNKDLNDTERVQFLRGYIGAVLDATRYGSNIRGYFVWSFVDVFEYLYGYQWVLGLYHVNFEDKDLKRTPKLSAHWYSNFLKGRGREHWIERATLHEALQ
ncbi:Beta-glucosidase 22 [Acorus gramineus]|uniref:Beta-glucosidase 22 n=1 Tax=Acorus gramineus TaxID=55184 RepID=A0AAV9BX26_ACOGR|nr:Beta-glucosidase 22 [Acorus gramineus]